MTFSQEERDRAESIYVLEEAVDAVCFDSTYPGDVRYRVLTVLLNALMYVQNTDLYGRERHEHYTGQLVS